MWVCLCLGVTRRLFVDVFKAIKVGSGNISESLIVLLEARGQNLLIACDISVLNNAGLQVVVNTRVVLEFLFCFWFLMNHICLFTMSYFYDLRVHCFQKRHKLYPSLSYFEQSNNGQTPVLLRNRNTNIPTAMYLFPIHLLQPHILRCTKRFARSFESTHPCNG